ncbi:MAG: hypothetical protein EBU90_22400, partial [Proteobacteria bacterium]|nr:hypothetical protein [Pseudomonadota bacterium]
AVAAQTAELRKTLKAGEGLETIKDKIQLMTFATNQLEVDSVTAAKSVEIIGKAFNLSTNEMKAFFSQGNQMEDFYGAMVTGGDLLEIVARMPITLLKNTKLMNKEATLMLATFSKANTNLDASAVGYNLGKVLEGGTKARGGGIIAMAEKQGKTVEQYLFDISDEFKKLKTVAEQNDFMEMVTGTNDLQAKDVFRSLLSEIGKVDKQKVASFQEVQKQFEQGKISSIEYRKAMEKLNEAEKTFVARFISTAEGLKEFNRVLGLLADTHEATLGRIGASWHMVSAAFGNTVIFPALNVLASGLEKVTPFMVGFINQAPLFIGVLGGMATAFIALKAATLFFATTGATNIVTMLGTMSAALTKIAAPIAAAVAAYEMLKIGYTDIVGNKDTLGIKGRIENNFLRSDYIKEATKGLSPQERFNKIADIDKQLDAGKTVGQLRSENKANTPSTFAPAPVSAMQFQQSKSQVEIIVKSDKDLTTTAEVVKQDNGFLDILKPTTMRTV